MPDAVENLKRIQGKYLDLLDDFFSPIYRYADDDIDHRQLADFISRYPLIADLLHNSLEDLGETIGEFWATEGKELRQNIENLQGLKCLYSGDISPSDAGHLIRKSALYVDTTIIPDPIYRITKQLRPIALNNREYLNILIRHVFNVWRTREILVSESRLPIMIVAPVGIDHLEGVRRDMISNQADAACVGYLNEVFGRRFPAMQECLDWAQALKGPDDLLREIKSISSLPADFQDLKNLVNSVSEFNSGKKDFGGGRLKNLSFGQDFVVYLRTYFIRVEEHRHFCASLGAEPIYDFKRPWFFMNRALGGPDIDSAVIQALQDDKFAWIGNAPIAAIKRLRETDELEYMRQTLRTGIYDIKARRDKDLEGTVSQVQKNLEECFDKHQAELKDVEAKINAVSKVEMPITIAAALVGWIPVVGNFLSAPFSVHSLFKSAKDYKDSKQELAAKQSCAINFLLRVKQ